MLPTDILDSVQPAKRGHSPLWLLQLQRSVGRVWPIHRWPGKGIAIIPLIPTRKGQKPEEASRLFVPGDQGRMYGEEGKWVWTHRHYGKGFPDRGDRESQGLMAGRHRCAGRSVSQGSRYMKGLIRNKFGPDCQPQSERPLVRVPVRAHA